MAGDINAHLIFHPAIHITAERFAEVLDISLHLANKVLSQPDTKQIIMSALERSFQETVDKVLFEMSRIPLEIVPTRVDCTVKLPALPPLEGILGL